MQLSHPLPLSDAYREAIRFALKQHAAIAILCLLVLDGGHLAKLCGLCLAGFWIGIFLMMARRPLAPTHGDLLFARYGFLPLFIAAISIVIF